jgi:hypothetical protein
MFQLTRSPKVMYAKEKQKVTQQREIRHRWMGGGGGMGGITDIEHKRLTLSVAAGELVKRSCTDRQNSTPLSSYSNLLTMYPMF